MATRLIIDSCRHYIEVFGVDGFRFDLAELLGVSVLHRVEQALTQIKSDVIRIAEPWSRRGNIAGSLFGTQWASWNDGNRESLYNFVCWGDSANTMQQCVRGSPAQFEPTETINYTESHDDRTWIDKITENANFDGESPTPNDRKRTHLMAALLFVSPPGSDASRRAGLHALQARR